MLPEPTRSHSKRRPQDELGGQSSRHNVLESKVDVCHIVTQEPAPQIDIGVNKLAELGAKAIEMRCGIKLTVAPGEGQAGVSGRKIAKQGQPGRARRVQHFEGSDEGKKSVGAF